MQLNVAPAVYCMLYFRPSILVTAGLVDPDDWNLSSSDHPSHCAIHLYLFLVSLNHPSRSHCVMPGWTQRPWMQTGCHCQYCRIIRWVIVVYLKLQCLVIVPTCLSIAMLWSCGFSNNFHVFSQRHFFFNKLTINFTVFKLDTTSLFLWQSMRLAIYITKIKG